MTKKKTPNKCHLLRAADIQETSQHWMKTKDLPTWHILLLDINQVEIHGCVHSNTVHPAEAQQSGHIDRLHYHHP